MSAIEEAIARKKRQLPQFDYMWRVELPELGAGSFIDPSGVLDLNCSPEAADFITGGNGGGAFSSISNGFRRVMNVAEQYLPVTFGKSGGDFGSGSRGLTQIALKNDKLTSDLNHRVFSIDAPYRSFEVEKNIRAQQFFYTASTSDVGTINIRIDEYEDGATLDYLMQWQLLIRNSDGTNNPPAAYKRDLKLIRMSSSGLDLHVTIYKGCFPSEISPTSFNYESNAIMQYSVSMPCDNVEHLLIPAAEVIRAVEEVQPSIIAGDSDDETGDFLSMLNKNAIVKNLTTAAITEINRRVGRLFF